MGFFRRERQFYVSATQGNLSVGKKACVWCLTRFVSVAAAAGCRPRMLRRLRRGLPPFPCGAIAHAACWRPPFCRGSRAAVALGGALLLKASRADFRRSCACARHTGNWWQRTITTASGLQQPLSRHLTSPTPYGLSPPSRCRVSVWVDNARDNFCTLCDQWTRPRARQRGVGY